MRKISNKKQHTQNDSWLPVAINMLLIVLLVGISAAGVLYLVKPSLHKTDNQPGLYEFSKAEPPLEFKKKASIFEIDTNWFPSLPKQLLEKKDQKWSDLYCLDFDTFTVGRSFRVIQPKISDDRLIKALQKIENFEFSDERTLHNMDGTLTIENKGKRSKKSIIYEAICKTETTYYMLFRSEMLQTETLNLFGIRTVYAGGGFLGPVHFAMVQKDSSFELIEDLGKSSSRIAIPDIQFAKENYPAGYVMPKENFLPYYGCQDIVGKLGESVYIVCGGGDGPAGGLQLFQVDTRVPKATEIVFCTNIFPQENKLKKQSCYDETGKIFFQKDLNNSL